MGSTTHREPVEFRVLGSFEVVSGGQELAIGSGQQRVLLASLVLRLNHVVPRDELVELLWGEAAPPSAATSLHSLVSRLRRILADCSGGAEGVVLETREPGYVLRGAPDRVDAHRFEELAARARELLSGGEPAAAARLLRQAVALWRGRPLLDVAGGGHVRMEAERLEEARLAALEDLADAELACGHLHEAVGFLEPHVATHPFRERAWGQLMLALYRLGRQADALAAYRRVRAVITDELGVEPTPALRRLEEQILHQSPELDGPEAASASPPTPNGGAGALEPCPPATPHNLPVGLTPFVGRVAELEELRRLACTVRLLTLTGVGGVGKTRLAVELAAAVLEEFPDGVWLAELGSLQDPGLVADEVTAAVGVPSIPIPGGPCLPEERLCAHLRRRRALIVLDNCEHLVEAAARVARTVLTHCPDMHVIATSRELLGHPGEVVWAVPPLSLPAAETSRVEDLAGSDAVALFCDRAGAAQPGFAVSMANAKLRGAARGRAGGAATPGGLPRQLRSRSRRVGCCRRRPNRGGSRPRRRGPRPALPAGGQVAGDRPARGGGGPLPTPRNGAAVRRRASRGGR
jgi:DNA-binding SARP family transcriptional activator